MRQSCVENISRCAERRKTAGGGLKGAGGYSPADCSAATVLWAIIVRRDSARTARGGSNFESVVSLTLTDDVRASSARKSLRKQERKCPRQTPPINPWLTLSMALSALLWVFIPEGFFPYETTAHYSGHFAGNPFAVWPNAWQAHRIPAGSDLV